MKIIKNLLSSENTNLIKSTLSSSVFPWFFNNCVTYEGDGHHQFTSWIYKQSTKGAYFFLVEPIIKIINPRSIIRIKSNLIPRSSTIVEHPLHIDNKLKNNMTAIYYVNTNNGYTRFKNENKIPSEQNKLIIFNTETEHSGTTCTDEPCRIVINFNYYTF